MHEMTLKNKKERVKIKQIKEALQDAL